jgi:hypothetical protein
VKTPTLLASLLIGLSTCLQASSANPDPGPVVVADTTTSEGRVLKVLRTADGRPIRGPTLWQWKSSSENNTRKDRNALLEERRLFEEFRDAGMTAVRLASFEVWFQSDGQPHADWSWSQLDDSGERRRMLRLLEKAVDSAAAAGLYIIINAHNKFNAYDHDYTTAFWEVVAPHFAKRTHVLYELANEIKTGPADYTDEDIRRHAELSRRVRELAPAVLQIVLTPSGTWAPSNPDGSGLDEMAMHTLAERFDTEWHEQGGACDWSLTAVGYHLYFNGKTSTILKNLHEHYPGLPTEVGYPEGIDGLVGVKPDDTARTEQMDGAFFVNEVCERLGLGWIQWQTETAEKWRGNIRLLIEDARQKNYHWK